MNIFDHLTLKKKGIDNNSNACQWFNNKIPEIFISTNDWSLHPLSDLVSFRLTRYRQFVLVKYGYNDYYLHATFCTHSKWRTANPVWGKFSIFSLVSSIIQPRFILHHTLSINSIAITNKAVVFSNTSNNIRIQTTFLPHILSSETVIGSSVHFNECK